MSGNLDMIPRESLINAGPSEDVLGGMSRDPGCWGCAGGTAATCGGSGSPDPVRRSRTMINQYFLGELIEPCKKNQLFSGLWAIME
jgi:hypothetical protein